MAMISITGPNIGLQRTRTRVRAAEAGSFGRLGIARAMRLAALGCLAFSAVSAASWPPDDVAKELGLPAHPAVGREVRVWLGGGVVRPYDLYRVFETKQGVVGERIVWTEVTHEELNNFDAKQASQRTAEDREMMVRQFCKGPVSESANYLFCRTPIETDVHWSVVLDDLLPDRLWSLPPTLERHCGWSTMDGEVVGIDILSGGRRNSVSYANPEFCCAEIPCAIADHVRDVVRQIR